MYDNCVVLSATFIAPLWKSEMPRKCVCLFFTFYTTDSVVERIRVALESCKLHKRLAQEKHAACNEPRSPSDCAAFTLDQYITSSNEQACAVCAILMQLLLIQCANTPAKRRRRLAICGANSINTSVIVLYWNSCIRHILCTIYIWGRRI